MTAPNAPPTTAPPMPAGMASSERLSFLGPVPSATPAPVPPPAIAPITPPPIAQSPHVRGCFSDAICSAQPQMAKITANAAIPLESEEREPAFRRIYSSALCQRTPIGNLQLEGRRQKAIGQSRRLG